MKKKIIISSIICFAVAAFVTSYSVLSNSNSLIMANLQALSTDEDTRSNYIATDLECEACKKAGASSCDVPSCLWDGEGNNNSCTVGECSNGCGAKGAFFTVG